MFHNKLRKIYNSIKTKQLNADEIEAMDWWDINNPSWNVLSSLIEGLTSLPTDRVLKKVQALIAVSNNHANSEEEFAKIFMQNLMVVFGGIPGM